MRIKYLKLTNFGQHKSLEVKDIVDKTIIGILGENGSGKSTIISAIKYAFTGELPDTNSSCIRSGAKSLNVELEFEKNGILGKISRSVNASNTSSRKLIWENIEYTKANDVESKLQEILGIDKQVLSNTIFISQGEFSDILSKTKTKRIDIFSKLLNLNYLNKTVNTIDSEQKVLKESIKDLSLIKEQYQKDLDIYAQKEQDLLQNIKFWKDQYVDFDICKQIVSTYNEYNRLASLPEFLSNEINGLKQRLDILDIINYKKEIDKLSTEVDEQSLKLEELTSLKYKFEKYNDLTKQLTVAKEESKRLKANIPDLEEKVKLAEKEEENIQQQVNTLSNVISQLTTLAETKQKLLNKLSKDSVTCPLCGLKLVLGQKMSENDIADIRQSISTMQVSLGEAKNKLSFTKINSSNIKNLLITENVKIQQLEQNNIPKLSSELMQYSSEQIEVFENTNMFNLSLDIEELGQEVKSLQSRKLELQTKQIEIEQLKSSLSTKETSFNNVLLQLSNNKFKALLTNTFKESQIIEIYKPEEAVRQIQEGISNFQVLIKLEQELVKTKQDLDIKGEAIKKLEEDNVKTFSQISNLEIAKNALSIKNEQSIPKQYLKYLFLLLTKDINNYLLFSDSNFYIELDQREDYEGSLSFKYKKYGKEDIDWLNMEKLSGGEEVKLATTFLVSIQKLICNDLCFLVLDEPTTHLDERNINALVDFIKKLNNIFNNTTNQGQIWIIDHNPKLESAFDHTIKLN